jgi:hypothetical protein
MVIRDGKETKPKEAPKYIADNHLLQTKDITGAGSDTRYASPFPRREWRNTNFIGDIAGAHADTIKHSIQSKRMSNPLQPVYQALDPGEMLLPLIQPLIPAEMVKIPTLPSLNREAAASSSQLKVVSKSAGGAGSAGGLGNTFDGSSTWGTATFGQTNQFDSKLSVIPLLMFC